MRYLFSLIFLSLFSFSLLGAGFDSGGGAGKVAIAIYDKVISTGTGIYIDKTAVGVVHFKEIVSILGSQKELIVDTNLLKLSEVSKKQVDSGSSSSRFIDPLLKFKMLASEGPITVLFIDFEEAIATEDGKTIFRLKEDWGTSLKVYQIGINGEISEEGSDLSLSFKAMEVKESYFSVHVFLEEVADKP